MYKQDLEKTIANSFNDESFEVTELTKRNIKVFASKTGIKESYFPKPVQEDIVMQIHNAVKDTECLHLWESDYNYTYLLLAYMFSGIRCKMKGYRCGDYSTLQPASNVCFLLALNNFRIISTKPIHNIDFENLCKVNMSGPICYEDSVLLQRTIKRCGLSITNGETELKSVVLPNSLRKHLGEQITIDDIVLEICCLQLSSPKTLRSQNPLEALLQAWKKEE